MLMVFLPSAKDQRFSPPVSFLMCSNTIMQNVCVVFTYLYYLPTTELPIYLPTFLPLEVHFPHLARHMSKIDRQLSLNGRIFFPHSSPISRAR